ncbi:MAG TPA: glycosyltransferase family 87 protein [Bryobacteraceae bacterium]
MTARTRKHSLIAAGLVLLAVACSLFLAKDVDLRVYWFGVTGFFSGTKPAYGPHSGIGFPMGYRYPPATYLLLYPLKFASLHVAGFWWMLAAWANAAWVVWLAFRVRGLRFNTQAAVACCAFLLAYVYLAIHYGNVQPFVIAWMFAALILAESHPRWAGLLLALSVTFKIWPILFLPLLLHRQRIRSAGWFAGWLAALWAFPLLIFGPSGYGTLLHDWYLAVRRVGDTYSELYYFPGQSLRGIFLRYFTPVNPPLSYFTHINFLSVSPKTAIQIWMGVNTAAYAAFAIGALRARARQLWAWDGLAFVVYSLLEPFAVKSGLISLAPAALTAACLFTLSSRRKSTAIRWANCLFLAACAISFGQALLQYLPWQRLLLSYGADFWGNILLVIAFLLWIRERIPEKLGVSPAVAEAGELLPSPANLEIEANG